MLFSELGFGLELLELLDHLVPNELQIALVVYFVAGVSREDGQAMVTEQVANDLFLLLGEH